jgi:xylulose-5-phosphate/fructose-6-phosphate phosphoketolase
MILAPESRHPHALSAARFRELFTADRPVLFNYHGYPTELQGLLFGREGVARMDVAGYIEEGSTTTPFDMMLVNRVSRFDVAQKALRAGAEVNEEVKGVLEKCLGEVKKRVEEVRRFIVEHGKGEVASIFFLSLLVFQFFFFFFFFFF